MKIELVPLEILNGALVLFRGRPTAERTKISAFSRPRIDLARVEPVLAGFEFPNH